MGGGCYTRSTIEEFGKNTLGLECRRDDRLAFWILVAFKWILMFVAEVKQAILYYANNC